METHHVEKQKWGWLVLKVCFFSFLLFIFFSSEVIAETKSNSKLIVEYLEKSPQLKGQKFSSLFEHRLEGWSYHFLVGEEKSDAFTKAEFWLVKSRKLKSKRQLKIILKEKGEDFFDRFKFRSQMHPDLRIRVLQSYAQYISPDEKSYLMLKRHWKSKIDQSLASEDEYFLYHHLKNPRYRKKVLDPEEYDSLSSR